VTIRGMIIGLGGVSAGLALGWLVLPAVLYTSEPQPLHFSHKTHMGERVGMTCEVCHEFAADGTFEGIPSIAECSECHSSLVGTSEAEKRLVEEFVTPKKEIPWKIYLRQPDNAFFPHSPHVKLAKIGCTECHGPHGESDQLRPYEENRLTGYSRDVWGRNIAGIHTNAWEGMKMDRCVKCHQERNRTDGCIICHK
jgi:menaquinone reductase, multiheme cytochrome c subunit